MDKILLLENRDDVVKDLKQLITEVEPHVEFERFSTMAEFFNWTQLLTKSTDPERSVLAPGEHVLLLVINEELLGPQHMGLIEKLSEALKARSKLKSENLPALFIGYEADENFSIDKFGHPLISNIFFKPFDQVVCTGKLLFALYGPKALGKFQIYKEAPVDEIEMRTEIAVHRLHDTGFYSLSRRKMEVGEFSCYYNFPFMPKDIEREGLYATCRESSPAGADGKMFENKYEFLSLDLKVMKALKAHIQYLADMEAINNPTPKLSLKSAAAQKAEAEAAIPPLLEPFAIAIIHSNPKVVSFFRDQISETLGPTEVVVFPNFLSFLMEVTPEAGAKEASELMSTLVNPQYSIEMTWTEGMTSFVKFEREPDKKVNLGLQFSNMFEWKKQVLLLQTTEEARERFLNFWNQGKSDENFVFETHLQANAPSGSQNPGGPPNAQQDSLYLCLSDRNSIKLPDGKAGIKMTLRPAKQAEILNHLKKYANRRARYSVAFIDELVADSRDLDFWNSLRGLLNSHKDRFKPVVCRIGHNAINNHKDRFELFNKFDGHFTEITDRDHLALWLLNRFPGLRIKDDFIKRHQVRTKLTIQSGGLLKLKGLSEVFLTLSYVRQMIVNSVRFFTFLDPENNEFKCLPARCIHSEKDPEVKNQFVTYFVFYGLREQDNLLVRRWMLHQYHMKKADR